MIAGLSIAYWLGLLAVIAGVVVLGTYAARKIHSADDFALAGRSSGAFMVMGIVVGTAVGASSTVGTSQLAFKAGVSAWWFCLGCCIGFIIMAFLYVKPLYSSKQTTVTQFLASAYDKRTGMVASVCSVIGIFFSAAASSLVLIPMLANCFSMSLVSGALLSLLLIILYVFFGGAWATGLVGIFKAGLLYVVLGTCFFASLETTGGVTTLLSRFPAHPWFTLFPNGFITDIASGASTVIGVMCTQTYIQGFLSAKNEKAAFNGMILSGVFTVISAAPAVWVGLFMKVYHPDISPIDALPLFIMSYLPDWFAGVSTGMLIIASVGSAAGLILGMSTIFSADIVSRVIPSLYEKRALFVTRSTVLAITSAILVFTYINNDALVLDWTILSMCLRGAGVFVPLLMAIFRPGLFKSNYATAAIAGGSIAALSWRLLFPQLYSPLYPGMLVSVLFMLLGYRKRTQVNDKI